MNLVQLPDLNDGRIRVVVETLLPVVDGGRFAVKRVLGQPLEATVHAFADGHDVIRVMLCWRAEGAADFTEVEMAPAGNDEWVAAFTPPAIGRYEYTAVAWLDHFRSWRTELGRRVDAEDVLLAARAGATLAEEAAERAANPAGPRASPQAGAQAGRRPADAADSKQLAAWAAELRALATSRTPHTDEHIAAVRALALDEKIAAVADRHPDRRFEAAFESGRGKTLPLTVDRVRAAFCAWYEMFPRSAAPEGNRHGTFKDVIARLPYVAEMGFDVLYLPPIHPIGRVKRKGPNNALDAGPDDVGSPWAIGSSEGGHKALLPELGTAQDFRDLVEATRAHGMEIAMDIAFQCAPDHPYVTEHPQWFRKRPDGSMQFAENPPKKYQDIYPFDFETEDWRGLWAELKGIFDHWIGEGVKIFRVDNPHTKAFGFWEWVVAAIRQEHPDVLFLAEAFTRPKVMHRLAKLGYSQSYTYFTWRNTRDELIAYFTELNDVPGRDYFRPNVWPNTPDILNVQLHEAPRSVFMTRLLLAATLSPCYGIYGPAYELLEGTPRAPGSEEYLDSEKYQIRRWNLDDPASLAGFIGQVNRIRRGNPALQAGAELRFFNTDNPQLIAYGRRMPAGQATQAEPAHPLITVVNLDPQLRQSGWIHLDTQWLGIEANAPFSVHDLLTGQTFGWQGSDAFVILDPQPMPAHIFRVGQIEPT